MAAVAEVVVSWGDALLEVRCSSPTSANAPSACPIIVERDGQLACLAPEGARISLVTRGAYRSPRELESDHALERPPSGGALLPLRENTTARIEIGPLTFEVRASSPLPPPPRPRSSWMPAWVLLSFALHLPLLVVFALTPPRVRSLRPEPTAETQRLARRLPVVEEREAPLEATGVGGGVGRRHDGDEGTLGAPQPATSPGRYAVPRDVRPPRLARSRSSEANASAGVIGVLRAASWNTPASPYGADEARGHDDVAVLGALMGEHAGDARGSLGLGMRGTGRGGGGTGRGTIGLGRLRTIGHGAGCVAGDCEQGSGYGRGAGGLRHRCEPRCPVPRIHCAPGPAGCAAAIRGGLSREVIRREVRRRLPEVRFCYERRLQERPSLEGRVSVQWLIGPDGRVTSASLASSSANDAELERCILQSVRRFQFPRGESVTGVTYPFVLRSE